MASAIRKSTLRDFRSVDFAELLSRTGTAPDDWVAYGKGQANTQAAFEAATAIPLKYRKLRGDAVAEMTQPEKDAVDAAEAAAEAERQQRAADKQSLQDEFASIRDDIVAVRDGTATNLNQVNAALNRLAVAQLKTLRALRAALVEGA